MVLRMYRVNTSRGNVKKNFQLNCIVLYRTLDAKSLLDKGILEIKSLECLGPDRIMDMVLESCSGSFYHLVHNTFACEFHQ